MLADSEGNRMAGRGGRGWISITCPESVINEKTIVHHSQSSGY